MKKVVSLMLMTVVCFSILAVIAGCAKTNDASGDAVLAGGYTADRELEADDLVLFETVMANLDGVGYTPTLVATQVVAGTNYRFTATATPIVPNAEPYTVYVYIYQQLDGTSELTEIVKIN